MPLYPEKKGIPNKEPFRIKTTLLTHSQMIYGHPVETCRPYPCDYMSARLFD